MTYRRRRCFGPAPLAAVLALVGAAIASPALAIEPIPDTPGWRGFLVLGGGYADLESNLVAGNRMIDLGRPSIDSVFGSPPSDDTFFPLVTGEIAYTFANGWQAFFGTSLEDAITMDAVSQAGVRKSVGQAGIVQAGILFSGFPTRLWQDPYAEAAPRVETDRESTGVRLQWDRVLGTAFELTASWRDIDFDSERSGQGVVSVACDSACQALLRRDGDQLALDVAYLYRLGAGRNHLLRPRLRYVVDDRDGDAIAGDSWYGVLSYVYVGQGYTVASNLLFGQAERDARNPIFGAATDADRLAADVTLFYRLPAASGRWQLVANATWGDDNNDVTFHDSELLMLSLGVMYRFGSR